MTVTQKAPSQTPSQRVVTFGQSRARRDQLFGIALMLVFLAIIFAIQPTLTAKRAEIVQMKQSTLRQLSVEFPRLTLSGFRGLLVTMLWQKAEDAKNERQWTQLGSYYNIIAKMEPYFVTVYIFNAWNQAYNLSAQWHGIEAKYKWVLDGLEHLYEGESYNPGNPDILNEQSQMYFMKLGNSFERIDYRKFWRDSIAHQYTVEQLKDSMMDEAHRKVGTFVLKPQFNASLMPLDDQHPTKLGYGIEVLGLKPDGLDKPDRPLSFRYGVSPFYFAFIEYQRCLKAGRPTTTGIQVVDAYPAMSLRMWCRDDAYYATTMMKEMFQDEHLDSRQESFDLKVLELRDCFRNIELIAPRSADEFTMHLQRYPTNKNIHTKHKLEVLFVRDIARGERELFEGLVSWQLAGRKLSAESRRHLEKSIPLYNKAIGSVQEYLDAIYPVGPQGPNPDRADFEKYQNAMRERIAGIQAILLASENAPPDFKFLTPETIER